MSQIKGKNTKPEILVRKFLHANSFRYKLHDRMLPGKPDIVLPKYKTVVFVNGCFWHGHEECRFFVYPETKKEWWKNKIVRTIELDLTNIQLLGEAGWKVIVVWECELKNEKRDSTLKHLAERIQNV